jgi:hypothetical protein
VNEHGRRAAARQTRVECLIADIVAGIDRELRRYAGAAHEHHQRLTGKRRAQSRQSAGANRTGHSAAFRGIGMQRGDAIEGPRLDAHLFAPRRQSEMHDGVGMRARDQLFELARHFVVDDRQHSGLQLDPVQPKSPRMPPQQTHHDRRARIDWSARESRKAGDEDGEIAQLLHPKHLGDLLDR